MLSADYNVTGLDHKLVCEAFAEFYLEWGCFANNKKSKFTMFPLYLQSAARRTLFYAYVAQGSKGLPVNLTNLSNYTNVSRASLQRAKKEMIEEKVLLPDENGYSLSNAVFDEWANRTAEVFRRRSFGRFVNQVVFSQTRHNLSTNTRTIASSESPSYLNPEPKNYATRDENMSHIDT